jgi:hypothetical protein
LPLFGLWNPLKVTVFARAFFAATSHLPVLLLPFQ